MNHKLSVFVVAIGLIGAGASGAAVALYTRSAMHSTVTRTQKLELVNTAGVVMAEMTANGSESVYLRLGPRNGETRILLSISQGTGIVTVSSGHGASASIRGGSGVAPMLAINRDHREGAVVVGALPSGDGEFSKWGFRAVGRGTTMTTAYVDGDELQRANVYANDGEKGPRSLR